MSEKHIVKIEFWDHMEVSDTKLEEIKKISPIHCVAYGELISEGENHVTLLSCYQDDMENKDPQNHSMLIVKGAIISIKELREAQP